MEQMVLLVQQVLQELLKQVVLQVQVVQTVQQVQPELLV
jgi:hypothetical protein